MKKYSLLFYYFFLIFYLEIANKLFIFKKVIDSNYLYIIIYSILFSLVLNLISHLFNKRVNKIFTYLYTVIMIVFFGFQIVFYDLFGMYCSFSTLGLANQAAEFKNIAGSAIASNLGKIIVLLIPLVILFLLRKKFNFDKYNVVNCLVNLGCILIVYGLSFMALYPYKDSMYSAYNLYFNINALDQSVDKLGLLTSTKLDVNRNIFGFEEVLIQNELKSNKKEEDKEVQYGYNESDINFEELINGVSSNEEKDLLKFLENNTVTKKNKYTGYFKDKNLIFILAEGFNSIAVDENLTPTLYKLTHSGFTFDNYYSPLFLSTTGGEFQESTGLIPTQETLKIWKNDVPTISYALGNQFNNLGYTVNSYHNWTYKFYKRHKTMPTLGYNDYLACGNGLEKEINCKWLPSDVDMVEVTYPKFKDNEKFMVNYISVSGHAPYYLSDGNSIAKKNKDLVSDLPYSESVKAYIATQIEFDKALELLINLLKEDGKLDDTVLVITGDHYPYSLSLDEINELSSYKRDEIEVNHSNLIIWNSQMKDTINIKKTASQIDVLPTILNLFGIEYDSRLIIGHDILSDTDGLAIFTDRSWVSDKGTYYAKDKKFVSSGEEVSDDYITNMNTRVANSFTISNKMLKYNMYSKILGGK